MELALGRVPALAERRDQAADQRARRASRPTATSSSARRRSCATSSSAPASTPSASPSGGGAGMALAEWIADGEPPFDLWPVDIRRFGRTTATPTGCARARSRPTPSTTRWPGRSRSTTAAGRCARSPLYERLAAQGACFGEKLGWERPNWFAAPRGEAPRDVYTYGRPELVRRRRARAPRRAARRRRCSTRPRSPSSCWSGRDAEAALSLDLRQRRRQAGRRADLHADARTRAAASSATSPWRGSAEDEFYIVTGTGFATHDFDWIRAQHPGRARRAAGRRDIGDAVLALMGPRARDILAAVDRRRRVERGVPVRHGAAADRVAGAPVRALRVTYVGELGWELHVPVEFAATRLRRADGGGRGRTASSTPATARSRSLRLEKGYRAWGGRHRPGPHAARGRPRLGGEAASGIAVPRPRGAGRAARRSRCRSCSPASPSTIRRSCCSGARRSIRDGERVGWLTSGGFGYTIGRAHRLRLRPRSQTASTADYVLVRHLRAGGRRPSGSRPRCRSARSTTRRNAHQS